MGVVVYDTSVVITTRYLGDSQPEFMACLAVPRLELAECG
jgi:hypothetical protein